MVDRRSPEEAKIVSMSKLEAQKKVRHLLGVNKRLKRENKELREEVVFLNKTIEWMSDNTDYDLNMFLDAAKRIARESADEVQSDIISSPLHNSTGDGS